MKKQPYSLKLLLIFLTFLSCNKPADNISCPPTDDFLLYTYIVKGTGLIQANHWDTTYHISVVYKSNAGDQMPTLQFNNRNIILKDDSVNRCENGSKFASNQEKFPDISQTNQFLFGKTNTIHLTGQLCGTISDSFHLPNETKLATLSSNRINKNQDFKLSIIGADDFPIDIPNNGDPSTYFDHITLQIIYSRSISDTITYPLLPIQNQTIGREYSTPVGNLIVIPSSELQAFPLNGTVLLQFVRNTQTRMPDKTKGQLDLQIKQVQSEYFEIKN